MATLQEGQTNHLCCKCDIDSLLKRAINLIDPPLYPNEVDGSSTMMTGGNVNGDGSSELKSAILSAEQITSVPSSDLSTKPTTSTKTKKRVHFEESSFNKRNKLSAHDVIHAFKLLIHATSAQSSELSNESYYMKSTWKELQEYTDVYRALLITSCLLMEILPIESSGGEPMSDSSFNVKWESCNTICTPSPSNPPYTPFLSPTTIEQLLSTSRKCILQLQYLEKICAAKTIAERHTESLSFYSGGDDIEDYDRCTNDLHTNYDWHDDGFLPKPCSYNNGEDVCNNGVSILHECCYAPHNLSVQPSSRYEKNAATKEWIRGERLISMCVEDYYECFDDVSTYNREFTADMTNGKLQKQYNDIFNVEEDMPFFTLAPAELAQEEESLLDIMVPNEPTNSTKSTASLKRKKKRRKPKERIKTNHLTSNRIQFNSGLDWKEGYLLLIHDRESLSLTTRVFVKVSIPISCYFSLQDNYH